MSFQGISRRLMIVAGFVAVALGVAAGPAGAQSYTTLHSFTTTDGLNPWSSLVRAADGNFYGMTLGGGSGADPAGTFFRMDPSGAVIALYTFQTGAIYGTFSKGGIIQASDGSFYGVNGAGGMPLFGTIFKMTPAGVVSLVHAFVAGDGGTPVGGLVEGRDGNLYGTTTVGGSGCPGVSCTNLGTIFKVSKTGTFTWLHDFVSADGWGVQSKLIQATDDAFYGTTTNGGDNGYGTIFKITSDGTFTKIHSFIQTGASPEGSHAPLVQAANGSLYGTTFRGGTNGTGFGGYGTVFRQDLDVLHTYTTIHSFAEDRSEGINPEAGLIQGPDGAFYGTTSNGGGAGKLGTIYRIDGSGSLTVLHDFASTETVSASALTPGPGGNVYGTIASGATLLLGATYRLHVTSLGTTMDDFDGDGRTDVTIFRPSAGRWWTLRSDAAATTYNSYGWGLSGDVPVAGDFDGDGKFDPAVFRPSTGTWWILNSGANYTTTTSRAFGVAGDTPVPADYDGDGKTDIAVYRAGVWWILTSSNGYTTYSSYNWGIASDIPVPADFDGDGKADIAVFRPSTGTWFILKSSTGYASYVAYNWGSNGDVPVVADYDGDGKADPAIFRPSTGTWFILKSSTGYTTYAAYTWGLGTDTPVVGDFDGDGRGDVAIYRSTTGSWWILKSSSGFSTYAAFAWGISGDIAIGARP